MKFKPQITDIILIVSLVALCFGVFKISNLENENRVMKEKIKDKDSVITELEYEIGNFEDILQEREIEIKHWGMKYDSINMMD